MPLTGVGLEELLSHVSYAGLPRHYAMASDTNEAEPPILHRLRLWPAPDKAYLLHVRYQRAARGFDGTNERDTPLSWVSDDAILAGAQLRARMFQKDVVGAQFARDELKRFMDRMELVENGRTKPVTPARPDPYHIAGRWR